MKTFLALLLSLAICLMNKNEARGAKVSFFPTSCVFEISRIFHTGKIVKLLFTRGRLRAWDGIPPWLNLLQPSFSVVGEWKSKVGAECCRTWLERGREIAGISSFRFDDLVSSEHNFRNGLTSFQFIWHGAWVFPFTHCEMPNGN